MADPIASITPSAQVPAGLVSFREAAGATLSQLRASLAAMLSSLPGGCRRAIDLERSLRVDHATGWRLHKIASSPEPLATGVHVPGPTSMRRVLKAAGGEKAVPEATVAAVRDAYAAFEDLVQRYAGDRATFDSMISAMAGEEGGQIDLAMRRDVFRGNSHIWGVQASAEMHTYIAHPNSERPDLLDIATVRGAYDRRRLREGGGGMAVITSFLRGGDERPAGDRPDPLGDDPSGLLTAFSSGAIASRVGRQGPGEVRAEYDLLGIPSTTTMAFGNVVRGVAPWYRTDEDRHMSLGARVISPSEVLFLYALLHRGTFGRPMPEAYLLNDLVPADELESIDPYTCSPSRLLPLREAAEHIGQGIGALHSPELPRYTELMAWALARLGWDPESFDVYRLRIEYPALATRPILSFPLPERTRS